MKVEKFLIIIILLMGAFFIKLEKLEAAEPCTYTIVFVIKNGKIEKEGFSAFYSGSTIKNVKKDSDGEWEGVIYDGTGGSNHENIQRWNKDSCPDYIAHNGVYSYDFYGLDAKTVEEQGAKLYEYLGSPGVLDTGLGVYIRDGLKQSNGDYICDYKESGIKIYFGADGKAQRAESTNNIIGSSTTLIFHYDLSDRMKNESVAKPGTCEDIVTCKTKVTTTNVNYTIFVDEVDYGANKQDCIESFLWIDIDPTQTTQHGKGCRTYEKMIENMDLYHTKCSSASDFCNLYVKEKNNLLSACGSITKFSDYDNSPCLRMCLNVKDDIYKIEGTNLDEKPCGFSSKLINFIANIVKWGKYLIPVIVIVLGILDFIKAIATDKEDEMKKAQSKFIRRLIAAALIFIIPFIIEFVLDKMGFNYNDCGIIDL